MRKALRLAFENNETFARLEEKREGKFPKTVPSFILIYLPLVSSLLHRIRSFLEFLRIVIDRHGSRDAITAQYNL